MIGNGDAHGQGYTAAAGRMVNAMKAAPRSLSPCRAANAWGEPSKTRRPWCNTSTRSAAIASSTRWVAHKIARRSRTPQLENIPHEIAAAGRIEPNCCLVHDQQARRVQQRAGKFDTTPISARKGACWRPRQLRQAVSRQACVDRRTCAVARKTVQVGMKLQIVADRQFQVERRLLEHDAEESQRLDESVRRSCPHTSIEPASGMIRPVISCSKVDLPAPLGPSRTTSSPAPTFRPTELSALIDPKTLLTPRTSSVGRWLSRTVCVLCRSWVRYLTRGVDHSAFALTLAQLQAHGTGENAVHATQRNSFGVHLQTAFLGPCSGLCVPYCLRPSNPAQAAATGLVFVSNERSNESP